MTTETQLPLTDLLADAEDTFESTTPAPAVVIPEDAILVNGLWLNPETGDIYGADVPKPEFVVDSDEALNWVLGKIIDADAAIAAIDGNEEVLRAQAVLKNADAMRKKAEGRKNWLIARFQPEVAAYAKTKLVGKSRTYETLLGKVKFTAFKEKLVVADVEMAIRWAKYFAPDAVRTKEEFLISHVPDEAKAKITAEDLGFKIEPAGETVKIVTGVGK